MQVAAIQMVSSPILSENLAVAEQLIDQAAAAGAKLILLPEYFCQIGLHETDKFAIAETVGAGPMQDCIASKAKQHAIWIAAGSLPLRIDQSPKVSNTTLLYGPDGTVRARYDKLHLFSYLDGERDIDESRTMEAGAQVVTAETDVGRVGLSICYDLRFPELYRAMEGVDLIVVPSAFTETTGRAHWEVLLRARAIENQCYVLAAAQGGTHSNGRRTFGHSMLIDPWGEIVASLPQGEGVVIGEMSQERLVSVRKAIPALKHRRIPASAQVKGVTQ